MKKFFAIVFTICFVMSGCQVKITVPAKETESSVGSEATSSITDAGDKVNSETSQPATNQQELIDEQIIAHCRTSAGKSRLKHRGKN